MSKFLAQSKTFLPMVIQKSTSDTVHILENHPSLCSKPIQKAEALDTNKNNQEVESAENSTKSMIQRKLETTNTITVIHDCQRTLLEAFIMDVMQIQERIAVVWAQGHLWLLGRPLGLLRGLQGARGTEAWGPKLLWIEGQLRPKEVPPSPVPSPEKSKKAKSTTPKAVKTEDKRTSKENRLEKKTPFKSNFWETIQEKSPAWQIAIAARLGALQKTVVQRLNK